MQPLDLRHIALPNSIGLRGHLPTRPERVASHPLLVHRLGTLLPASSRFRLTADTLAFS
jgi:hypothetical protein